MIHSKIKPQLFQSFIIAGAQRSGKTFLAKRMIKFMAPFYDQVVIITGTPYDGHALASKGLPNPQFYSFLQPDEEGKMINVGPALIASILEMQQACMDSKIQLRTLLVLDDWIPYIQPKSDTFKTFASFSRHINLSVMYLTQAIRNNIPTIVRQNCACWFIFRGLSKSEVEGISDYFPAGCKYTRIGLSNFHYDYLNKLNAKYSFIAMFRDEDEQNLVFCNPINERGEFYITERRVPTTRDVVSGIAREFRRR